MTPQGQKSTQHSPPPQRNKPQPSTGAHQGEAADQPFGGAADLQEVGVEETAQEVFPTEGHRMTQTRQEEYQEKHRPYPTPPISSSAFPCKYSQGTELRQKTSCYNGKRTAELTETTQHWRSPLRRP